MNYAGIGASSEFQRYIRLTKELIRVQIVEASREEKLAFFINIYNAQVIHANVTMGPPINLWQRYKVSMRQFVSSADDFANSLDPDQDQQNVGRDLNQNCMTL